MKRKIIRIEEHLCDGCGECITACSEGALELVDGVAKLVREDFCDGFGDCIGDCSTGALLVEEREAPAFDEPATRRHLRETQGEAAVLRMDSAQHRHLLRSVPAPAGCPGAQARALPEPPARPQASAAQDGSAPPSELRQWPIQIHLVPPEAPYFRDKELVVMSTCAPLAVTDVHQRYLRGRSVVVGCPKLDDTSPYVAKMTAILQEPTIPKVIVPRMEVPCCAGLTMLAEQAVRATGRDDLTLQEDVIGLDGTVKETRTLI